MNSETSRPTNRNKLLALVSILSALLIVAILYIIILESQNNQKESSNSNLVTRSESPASESSVTNNTRETTNNQKSENTVETEERIINQEGNFSYILPDGITQDDLWINVASIYEVKALDGPCSAFDEQLSQNNNDFFQNSQVGDDVSSKLQKSLPGAIKAELKENSQGIKYIRAIDICNGMAESNEIANALRFWIVIYQNNQEILIQFSVPQSTLSQPATKVADLELLANQLWIGLSTNESIQNQFNKFGELAESIKFGNN